MEGKGEEREWGERSFHAEFFGGQLQKRGGGVKARSVSCVELSCINLENHSLERPAWSECTSEEKASTKK